MILDKKHSIIMLPANGTETSSKGSESLPAGVKQYSFNGIVKCIEEYFPNGSKQPLFNNLHLCGVPIKEANGYVEKMWQPQHLFVLSDGKIKTGDWYYLPGNNTITKANSEEEAEYYKGKKIIATTNRKLKTRETYWCVNHSDYASECDCLSFPKISLKFIRKFIKAHNSGSPITEIMIEYTQTTNRCKCKRVCNDACGNVDALQLKINKNNEICVSKSRLTEKSILDIIKEECQKADVWKHININQFGHSQIERNIAERILKLK